MLVEEQAHKGVLLFGLVRQFVEMGEARGETNMATHLHDDGAIFLLDPTKLHEGHRNPFLLRIPEKSKKAALI